MAGNVDVDLLFLIVDTVLIGFSILSSIIIIVLFIHNREFRQLPSNRLLFNFMMTNFLLAATGMLLALSSKNGDNITSVRKFLFLSSFFIVSLISYTIALILVTVDRFYAVKFPYRYQQVMSSRNTNFAIACFWIAVVLLSIAAILSSLFGYRHPFKVSDIAHYILIIVSLVGMAILLSANVIIFKQFHRQIRHIRSTTIGDDGSVHRHLRRRTHKTAYLCLLLVGSFTVCWLPNLISSMMFVVSRDVKEDHVYIRARTSLFHLNHVLNPFLYVFLKRDVRKSLKKLFFLERGAIGPSDTSRTSNISRSGTQQM